MWQFDHKGVLKIEATALTEEQELALIEAGAEDFQNQDEQTIIYSALTDFDNVKKKIAELNLPLTEANLEFVPKERVAVQDEDRLAKFFESLDDNDDVNNFYTNADF